MHFRRDLMSSAISYVHTGLTVTDKSDIALRERRCLTNVTPDFLLGDTISASFINRTEISSLRRTNPNSAQSIIWGDELPKFSRVNSAPYLPRLLSMLHHRTQIQSHCRYPPKKRYSSVHTELRVMEESDLKYLLSMIQYVKRMVPYYGLIKKYFQRELR